MPHTRVLVYFDSDKRLTKLDLVTWSYAESLKAIPCTDAYNQTMTCHYCGHQMPTEFDFAEHYTVDDPRYPNLGHCPVRDNPLSVAEVTKAIDDSRSYSLPIDDGDKGIYT